MLRLTVLLATTARALQPCSTPVLVDGAERFVECGGPHAVEEAVFAFLGGLNDTARVGCATEACREAAQKKDATCSDDECTCGAGDWACARLVVEHAALPARWPPVSLTNVAQLCQQRAPVDGVNGSKVLVASASDGVRVAPDITTNLASRTWASWRDYCRRHGYAFFPLDLTKERLAGEASLDGPGAHWSAYSPDLKVELDYYLKVRSGHWHKIFLLRQLLEAACFEFYVVVDDDIVVTAPEEPLHAILADLPEDYLGAGADENYHHHAQSAIGKGYSFNTGLLATKGGAHSKRLLEAAWLEPFRSDGDVCWLKSCFAWDQAAVASLHGRVGAVHVFPYRKLQSFWNAHTCAPDFFAQGCGVENSRLAWRPGDFSAHLSGGDHMDRSHRLDLLREYLDEGPLLFENASIGLSTRRTALVDLALAQCGRDRVVDAARRAVDEVCDKVSRNDGRFVSFERSVLWPTAQLRAAVVDLYPSAQEADAAITAHTRALVGSLRGVVAVDAADGAGFVLS